VAFALLDGGKITTQMAENPDVGYVQAKASEMTRHLACAFLDSLFLGLWAIPNVYIGRFIEHLHLTGIDEIVLRSLQVLFGLSTLAPICIWIYKDIRIMIKKANRDIAEAGIVPIAVVTPASGSAITAGPEVPK
jgi:hypothetical protein